MFFAEVVDVSYPVLALLPLCHSSHLSSLRFCSKTTEATLRAHESSGALDGDATLADGRADAADAEGAGTDEERAWRERRRTDGTEEIGMGWEKGDGTVGVVSRLNLSSPLTA